MVGPVVGLACSPAETSSGLRWAEHVCALRSGCDCEDDEEGQCILREEERFGALFDVESNGEPNQDCLRARLDAIDALSCTEAETWAFAWESQACPLRTNFAGIGEPCLALGVSGELSWQVCESGLVCDASQKMCVAATPAPSEGQRCLVSHDTYESPVYCAVGLTCVEALCVVGESPTVDRPPIACSDNLLRL